MRSLLLFGASASLAVLTSCGFAAGNLTASVLFGEDLSDFATSADYDGLWAGSGVVCLASEDAEVSSTGLYEISGRVIADEAPTAEFTGNLIPCADAVGRVLTVQADSGEIYELGYAWVDSSGWDMTPWPSVNRGQNVDLVVRQSPGDADSAGFALFHANGRLVYALEASRGAPALIDGDIPGLAYRVGEEAGAFSTESCGDRLSLTVEFVTDSGMTTMYEGEDFGLQVGEEFMTTCSIASFEYTQDCDEPAAEVSWVMFR